MRTNRACLAALLPMAFACGAQALPEPVAAAGKASATEASTQLLRPGGRRAGRHRRAPGAGLRGHRAGVREPPRRDRPDTRVRRDPRIDRWRLLASAQAGTDVIANALLTTYGAPAGDTLRSDALARLRLAEPGNLAPLLLAADPVEPWLPAAGAHARADLQFHGRLRWMQSVLLAHPPGEAERAMLDGHDPAPDPSATVLASAILAATALPSPKPLFDACGEGPLDATPTRRGDDCRQLARILAEASDTRLLAGIGGALLLRTAATAGEQAEAEALRRRHVGQSWQSGRIASAEPDGGPG